MALLEHRGSAHSCPGSTRAQVRWHHSMQVGSTGSLREFGASHTLCMVRSLLFLKHNTIQDQRRKQPCRDPKGFCSASAISLNSCSYVSVRTCTYAYTIACTCMRAHTYTHTILPYTVRSSPTMCLAGGTGHENHSFGISGLPVLFGSCCQSQL